MTFNYKLCISVVQYICITISDQQEMGCFFVLQKPLILPYLICRLVIEPVGHTKKLPRNALFSNAIEVKKCGDVFEDFQNTNSTCLITI